MYQTRIVILYFLSHLRYFPATDEWQDVSPMNEARFGSAVVAHQGKMYVSGGFGVGKSILSSTGTTCIK